MPYALVTGAAGFIGEYVVREFVEQGWGVVALVHKRTSATLDQMAASGQISIVRGDLREFAALEDKLIQVFDERGAPPDAIAHCAGRASDVGRRMEFRRANYEPAVSLGQMVMRLGTPRFVFISTTDVYGLRDFNGEAEDQLPLHDNMGNPYPEFKIAAEEWIRGNMPPERYSIIRPAAVWGVGDQTLTPRIVSFLQSSPWIVHFGKWRGTNRWPLANVRNVASSVFLAAVDPEARGKAINVLDSEHTTVDEFYRILASIYLPEKKFRSVCLPLWVGKVFGAVISGASNALNLDHPFTDPSLYALYSVSSNLDLGNHALRSLLERSGRQLVTRDEGVDELRRVSASA